MSARQLEERAQAVGNVTTVEKINGQEGSAVASRQLPSCY